MAKLEISDVVRALSTTSEGNREFDVWILMIMKPRYKYMLINGEYFRQRMGTNQSLLKTAPRYTTNMNAAMSLIHKSWDYDIRLTKKFGEVVIKTEYNTYSCRAPTAQIGICYLVLKIADKEQYSKTGYKGPLFISEFMNQREFVQTELRRRAEEQKKPEQRRAFSVKANQLAAFLKRRSGQNG